MKVGTKRYLGDGVYAKWDGKAIELTTDRFYLESEVLAGLERFVADVKANVSGAQYTEEDGDNAIPDRWRR